MSLRSLTPSNAPRRTSAVRRVGDGGAGMSDLRRAVRSAPPFRASLLLLLASLSAFGCREESLPAERSLSPVPGNANEVNENEVYLEYPEATYFGRFVGSVADCDGDGRADYAVCMAFANQFAGSLRVY